MFLSLLLLKLMQPQSRIFGQQFKLYGLKPVQEKLIANLFSKQYEP
jgi:hypothetical protein